MYFVHPEAPLILLQLVFSLILLTMVESTYLKDLIAKLDTILTARN